MNLKGLAKMYESDVLDRISTLKESDEYKYDEGDIADQIGHWQATLKIIRATIKGAK